MSNSATWAIAVTFVVLAIADMAVSPARAGEDTTVRAFAAWQGGGQLIQTGPKETTFVGSLTGTVYAETEKGPLESGSIVCPATVKISLEDGSQTGSGRCTMAAKDGSLIFADVSCTGFRLVGCDGQFTLTGGTQRFQGITGGGPITLRSEFNAVVGVSDTVAQQQARGIMYWPALHYILP